MKIFSCDEPALNTPSTAASFSLKAAICAGSVINPAAGAQQLRDRAVQVHLILSLEHSVCWAGLLLEVLNDAVCCARPLVFLGRVGVASEDLRRTRCWWELCLLGKAAQSDGHTFSVG